MTTTWNLWQLDTSTFELIHRTTDLRVDLERITTEHELLDWIFHESEKSLRLTREDIGSLVQALNEILDPRENLSSEPFDVAAYLHTKYR